MEGFLGRCNFSRRCIGGNDEYRLLGDWSMDGNSSLVRDGWNGGNVSS